MNLLDPKDKPLPQWEPATIPRSAPYHGANREEFVWRENDNEG